MRANSSHLSWGNKVVFKDSWGYPTSKNSWNTRRSTVVWLLSRNFRNERHQWAGLRYFQDVSRKYVKIELCSEKLPKQGATRSKKQTCMGEMSIKGYIQKNGPLMPCFLASKLWSFLGVILFGSSIHFRDFQGYSFLIFLYSLEIMGNHNCKSSFGGTCFLDFPTIFTTNLRSADRSFIFSKVAHLAAVDHGKSLGTGCDTWQEAHMGFFATSLVVDRGMIV